MWGLARADRVAMTAMQLALRWVPRRWRSEQTAMPPSRLIGDRRHIGEALLPIVISGPCTKYRAVERIAGEVREGGPVVGTKIYLAAR
jgi:hypothetical protein